MFWRHNIFTVLWALLILVLTLMPGKDMPETHLLSFDKFSHVFVFAVLSLLMIIGFKKQLSYKNLKKKGIRLAMVVSFIYSLFIELMQSFVPGRYFEWYDLIANLVGCVFGALIFYVVYKI